MVHGKGMARRLTKFKGPFFAAGGSMAQSVQLQVRHREATASRTFPFWRKAKTLCFAGDAGKSESQSFDFTSKEGITIRNAGSTSKEDQKDSRGL